jgi:hypothetical protein
MNTYNQPQAPQTPGAASRFCTACGHQLQAGAAFCPNCGSAVPAAVTGYQPQYPQGTPTVRTAPPSYGQTSAQPYVQPYARPPADKTSKIRKTGLICFVVLAVLTLLLFILMKITVWGILANLAILTALWLVQRKLSAKGWLAGMLPLLCGLLLSFVLLVIVTPRDAGGGGSAAQVEEVVKPSDADTVVTFGKYAISIPAGAVSGDTTLTVTKAEGLPAAFSDMEPLCPAMDVNLGDLKQFDKPLVISLPYDKSKLKDVDPSDAFFAVYYDTDSGKWQDVPYEVDETAGVVRLLMNHLTTVQCYYSLWEGQMLYDNGEVTILYHMANQYEKYAAYDKAVGRSTGDKMEPQFVVDAADYASRILKAYAKANLSVPSHPKIYIVLDKNNYNGMTGKITITNDTATWPEPDKVLMRNLGHELYHAAQCQTIGFVDYGATSGKNVSFWVEACADYMGNTGVWELLGEQPVNKYEKYDMDFFRKSLYTMDGSHEYDAANFTDFVQSVQKQTAYDLAVMTESYSSFPGTFQSSYGGNAPTKDLLTAYRFFLEYTLFDGDSRYFYPANLSTEQKVKNKTAFQFELDDSGKGRQDLPPLEGKGAMNYPGAYTADFYVFSTNCDTTLTLTPTGNLRLYLVDRTEKGRSYELNVDAAAGQPADISFGKDDFILVAGVSDSAGAVSFTYKAAPTKPDLTGKWNMTQMIYTDVEGDANFFSALQSQFGYDKSGYLNAANESMQPKVSSVYLMLGSPAEGQHTLDMVVGGDTMQTLSFMEVQVNGNEIQAKGNFDGLWASIKLTTDGVTMTGVMRSQLHMEVGDATYTGTDVIQLAAEHEQILPAQ